MRWRTWRVRTVLAVALVAPRLAVSGLSPALAATEECGEGGLQILEIIGARIVQGKLVVPANGQCFLEGTTVTGNVTVGAGAALGASAATIGGDIRGDAILGVNLVEETVVNGSVVVMGARTPVFIDDVQIGGRVAITDSSGTIVIGRSAEIGGSLTVARNSAPISITNNLIGGSVQFNDNQDGPFTISDNEIRGSLTCRGNMPPPVGSGNMVNGRVSEDCEALVM